MGFFDELTKIPIIGDFIGGAGRAASNEFNLKQQERLHKTTSGREYDLREQSYDRRLGIQRDMGLTPQEIAGVGHLSGGGGSGSATVGSGPADRAAIERRQETSERDKDRATSIAGKKIDQETAVKVAGIQQGKDPDTMAGERRQREKELHKLNMITKSPDFIREMKYAGMSPTNVRALMALTEKMSKYPGIMQGQAPAHVYAEVERQLVAIESTVRREAHGYLKLAQEVLKMAAEAGNQSKLTAGDGKQATVGSRGDPRFVNGKWDSHQVYRRGRGPANRR